MAIFVVKRVKHLLNPCCGAADAGQSVQLDDRKIALGWPRSTAARNSCRSTAQIRSKIASGVAIARSKVAELP